MVHAQADAACHAAKEEGRNRYNLYHQDDEDIRCHNGNGVRQPCP